MKKKAKAKSLHRGRVYVQAGLNPYRLYRVERAVRRYSNALDQGRLCVRADGDRARQVTGFRERLLEQSQIEERIRRLLGRRGIGIIWFASYQNFGKRLGRLSRNFSGAALREMVEQELEYLVGDGLDREVLVEIREKVFEIEGPEESGSG